MTRRFTIACVGMTTCDGYIDVAEADPHKRRFSQITSLSLNTGGDALNAALNFAKMDNDCRLIGCIGEDAFGRVLKRGAAAGGVDTRFMMPLDGVHSSASNAFYYPPDTSLRHSFHAQAANAQLSQEMITDEMLSGCDHLYYASINAVPKLDRGAAKLLKRAKAMGLSTSIDVKGTHNLHFDVLGDTLHYCDIFIPNNREIFALTGTEDLEENKKIFEKYNLKVLGIKRGPDGLSLTDFKQDVHMDTLVKCRVLDAVGAGDAFFSAFVLSYLRGMSLEECGIVGSSASAICIGTRGASIWGRPYCRVVDYAQELGYDIPQD
ncbi:MAG: carbohydrate kinase family protein [Christensenellales bacterium]|jgi:sugar/nucleoside kinase (ribokinase family)